MNGKLIEGQFSQNLDGTYFQKGDAVEVMASVSDQRSVTVQIATATIENSAPEVTATGPSPVLVNRLVNLSGEAQDIDGDHLTYSWAQTAGPIVEINGQDSANSSFVSPTDFYGELRFAVTASDGEAETVAEVSVVVENAPPTVNSLILKPSLAYTDSELTANATASDADSQPLTTHYYWSVNEVAIADVDSQNLPAEHFVKGDQVSVTVEVTDGQAIAKKTATISILDSSPQISTSGVPERVEYGVPVSFSVQALDADEGDTTELHFLARPNGMEMDDSGNVTWTPTGPMFDTQMDVNWSIAATQGGNQVTTVGSSIVVEDANRLPPIARSGIHTTTSPGAIKAGDFNGDGSSELLITDFQQRLYTLKYDSGNYVQNWMYPYALASANGRISATAVGDLDGDGVDEILVGLDEGGYGNTASTRILVIDGGTRRLINFSSIDGRLIDAIRVADVDNDGAAEIVLLVNLDGSSNGNHRVEVRRASDLSLDWKSSTLVLGNLLEIGDTDGDGTLELVFSSGYVFGFNGNSYVNEWLYNGVDNNGNGFGYRMGIADLDADGQDEIIGIDSYDRFIRVYDGATKSIIAQSSDTHYNFSVGDVDDDSAAEILTSTNGSREIQLLSFDRDSVPQFSVDWTYQESYSPVNFLIGNIDSDSAVEYIWQHSTAEDIVVAGKNPDIGIEWENEKSFTSTSQYGGGELANISADGKRLIFFANGRLNRSDLKSGHAAKLDVNGDLTWGTSLDNQYYNQVFGIVTDVTGDGTMELLYAYRQTPALYSFYSDSVLWTAPNMTNSVVAVAKGKLNSDSSIDMAITTSDGAINAYDVKNEVLLWSIDIGGGTDIKVADLDGDGKAQVIAANYKSISAYLPNENSADLQYSLTLTDIPANIAGQDAGYLSSMNIDLLATGDIDGDGQEEVALAARYSSSRYWLIVLDATLKPISMTPISGVIRAVTVQNYGSGHRNILVSVSPSGYYTENSRFLEVDPLSGAIVSSSPELLGFPKKNDIHFVDLNDDGIPEVSYGTAQAMNFTR